LSWPIEVTYTKEEGASKRLANRMYCHFWGTELFGSQWCWL